MQKEGGRIIMHDIGEYLEEKYAMTLNFSSF